MTLAGQGYLCAFLMNLATGVFWAGITYLVKDWFHAEAWQLGLMGGLFAVARVLTAIVPGRIVGRFKRHHIMATGAFILSVSTGLVWFAPSIWFVVGLMVLGGIGQGLYWVALESYLADGVGPTELRGRMGWFNISWSIGDAAGCLLGGGLYDIGGMMATRWARPVLYAVFALVSAGIMASITGLILSRMHEPARNDGAHARDEEVPKSPGRGGEAGLGVFWTMALVANFLGMALRGVLGNIFPEFGKDVQGYSAFSWGVLLMTLSLARTAGFVYWQRQHDWEYRAGYFFWVQALLPLGALIIVFNSNYWIFLLAFALIGVGTSKAYYASLFYSMDSERGHEHRGGIHEVFSGGGMIVLLLAGALDSATGYVRAPYVFVFGILVVGMAIQLAMYYRSRRARA